MKRYKVESVVYVHATDERDAIEAAALRLILRAAPPEQAPVRDLVSHIEVTETDREGRFAS